MIQLTAEVLARGAEIGAPLRCLCAKWFKSASPAEKAAVIAGWYERDPDGLERVIKHWPNREEFHNLLIADYAERRNQS